MITLHNNDNMGIYFPEDNFNLIYADMVYENFNLHWIEIYWKYLKRNGIFIVQTDWHTNYLVRYLMESLLYSHFVNHLVWKNEWGNHPKNKFHQCYDDILIFCKGDNWKFDSSKIQVSKKTAKTNMNPSGRTTKTATAWIDDICLTTTSSERQRDEWGSLIKWQKPKKLYDRILAPFLDEGDTVADIFMGSGTVAEWAWIHDIDYVGIEKDIDIFNIAQDRIDKLCKENSSRGKMGVLNGKIT
jgi:DNA modification methylase